MLLQIELSLNLLVSVITSKHFQPDQCIAYYTPHKYINLQISPMAEKYPVILNDFTCSHGCRQFIVEDPPLLLIFKQFSPYHSCMIQNRNTDIKAIIILKETNIYLHQLQPYNYGLNVVIIDAVTAQDHFDILVYSNLDQNVFATLNSWDVKSKKFIYNSPENSIDRFFDNYWSKYPGTIINIEVNLDYPLLHIHIINNNVNFVALDIIFINLFAKYLNISTIVLAKNESIIHASFVKPSFFLAARSSIQAYNPQTYAATHYILVYYVPKPK